jgi:hypothetical protein
MLIPMRLLKTCLTLPAVISLSLQSAEIHRGLVSYYPLNGTSPDGTTTPDIVSGNDMVLNNMGAEAFIPGKMGNAITFNGVDQHAVYTKITENGLPISQSAAYTVAFWVQGIGAGQNDLRAFAEGSLTSNNPLLTFGTGNSTNTTVQPLPHIFRRDLAGTAQFDYRSTNAVFNGAWRHVALVDNNGAFSVYVDGILDSTRTYTRTTSPDETVSIGAIQRAAVSHWFKGSVDELALWNRALTQAEIQSLVAGTIETPVPKSAPFFTVQPSIPSGILVGDTVTLRAGFGGSPGISLQWQKNGAPIDLATGPTLTLSNVQIADNGSYTVVATSPHGTTTSDPAVLSVGTFPAPNLTNGMVAYWPLDGVLGTKTPDLASGYDMDLMNLTAADIVPGKWGNAFRFDATRQTLLRRINNPGEALPAYRNPSFSVSLWVRGLPQPDRRVFSEGSTANTQPLFNIGTHNGGVEPSVDSFIRTDTGATGNHRYSVAPAFDDTWHHIVYTQREVGGTPIAALYVDGVKDDIVMDPRRPLTLNTTSIGGILRGTPSAWFTGEIDDVAIWTRALSPEEAQLLSTAKTPVPPSRLQPLAIAKFGPDLPAIAKGDSVLLRWDLSKDANVVSIDNGIGEVTTQTIAGVGSRSVSPTETTTYTVTLRRGLDTLTARTTVTVIDGVANDWTLVDNFDRYPAGPLANSGYWADLRGVFGMIESRNGNHMVSIPGVDSAAVLNLGPLTIAEGQQRTLFFRMIVRGAPTAALSHVVGITDKNLRWYADVSGNAGPVARPTFEVDQWLLGTLNNVGGVLEFAADPLVVDQVYNVWIDIRNAPLADPENPADSFSVHIQRDGDAARTTVFADYVSDRDPAAVDPIIGGVAPNLDKLFFAGNNATDSALFDDFYISRGGYNATVPRAFGFTAPVTAAPPTVGVTTANGEIVVSWTGGTLESSASPTAGFTPVAGATTSPYRAAASEAQRFYRARR